MSQALVGVLIGGLIASIAPLITMLAETRRWKSEQRLEYLREKRTRQERLTDEFLTSFADAMANDSYSMNMAAEAAIFLPQEANKRFLEWMAEQNGTETSARIAYLEICVVLKTAIAEIDRDICALVMPKKRIPHQKTGTVFAGMFSLFDRAN